jgi:hypothetical protein
MQLLRLEVLAANARVIAMPIETQRARARADDIVRGDVTSDNTINNDAEGAPQVGAETLPNLVSIVISVGELPDKMAD